MLNLRLKENHLMNIFFDGLFLSIIDLVLSCAAQWWRIFKNMFSGLFEIKLVTFISSERVAMVYLETVHSSLKSPGLVDILALCE